jgi:hypothetical protein
VPMFYVWFDDLNLWRQRVFGRADVAEALPTAVDGAAVGSAPRP